VERQGSAVASDVQFIAAGINKAALSSTVGMVYSPSGDTRRTGRRAPSFNLSWVSHAVSGPPQICWLRCFSLPAHGPALLAANANVALKDE